MKGKRREGLFKIIVAEKGGKELYAGKFVAKENKMAIIGLGINTAINKASL